DNAPTSGPNGLPIVTSAITVNGHGATIERSAAASAFRHLTIDGGGHLTLNDLTLRGGSMPTNGDGASVNIRNGTLTATGCTFTDNHCGSGNCLGGALYLQDDASIVDLRDSTLSENSAVAGGAIEVNNAGTLLLTRVRVIDNVVTHPTSFVEGGGISSSGLGTITIVDSTISGNQALGRPTVLGALGGGLSDEGGATWTIDRTTISGNTVRANDNNALGGGIYEGGAATFTIRNSTISGNHVSTLSSSGFHACAGAGIQAEGGGTWTLNNVTITGNDVACTMGAVPRGAGIGVGA